MFGPRKKRTSNPQPPSTPLDHQHHYHRQLDARARKSRDFEASSRPSSVGIGRSTAKTFDLNNDIPLSLKLLFLFSKYITKTLTVDESFYQEKKIRTKPK